MGFCGFNYNSYYLFYSFVSYVLLCAINDYDLLFDADITTLSLFDLVWVDDWIDYFLLNVVYGLH